MANKNYILYNSVGEIVGSVACPLTDIAANAGDYSYVEGVGDPFTHKVSDGQIVKKTKQEIDEEEKDKKDKKDAKNAANLVEFRQYLEPELSAVDPNVIKLLKKMELLPEGI